MSNLWVAPLGTSYDRLPGSDPDPWVKVGSVQWERFVSGDLLSSGPVFMTAVLIPPADDEALTELDQKVEKIIRGEEASA